MRQKKIWFYMGGSGLDRTDDLQKFRRSGLDRIQFYRIRTGIGLKNFAVSSSLVHCTADMSVQRIVIYIHTLTSFVLVVA